jgi:hypothetical protein
MAHGMTNEYLSVLGRRKRPVSSFDFQEGMENAAWFI